MALILIVIGIAIFVVFALAAGVAVWFLANGKFAKARADFHVEKGMTYEQVAAIMGEPYAKAPMGRKLVCRWHATLNGQPRYIGAVFIDNAMVKFGRPKF
ncbi:MAG: outer membrane protein assembly factor BamE [Clostridiales bacterium]|jgi:hypothetical protein|nr:outer membrane protein assembly factor BamE [Clostridiales bacterium]